jgi:hypothetical protein
VSNFDEAQALLRRLTGGDARALVRQERDHGIDHAADAKARQAEIIARTNEQAIRRVLPPKYLPLATGQVPVLETRTLRIARDWFSSVERGVAFFGGVGAGKSAACALMGAEFIRAGKRSVSWLEPDDFTSAVLHSYDASAPKLGSDFVILDEMGREKKPDFEYALLKFLNLHSARFMITSNLKVDAFRARYDVALIDRLNDEAQSIKVKDASLRRQDGGF